MIVPRLLRGAPTSLPMICSAIIPVDEEIRFGLDGRKLEVSGMTLDDLQQAFDFLVSIAADKSATEVEKAELLATLVGPNWSSYARGLTPEPLLNRLAFAFARQLETTADRLSAWHKGDEE